MTKGANMDITEKILEGFLNIKSILFINLANYDLEVIEKRILYHILILTNFIGFFDAKLIFLDMVTISYL